MRLYLASRSPRRREMLAAEGFAHAVIESGIDDAELEPGRVSAPQWVAALAYLKARGGAEGAALTARTAGQPHDRPDDEGGWTVLGADTVCLKDGRIIGQPAQAEDARTILKSLEGGRHDVLTGVAIVKVGPASDTEAWSRPVGRAGSHVVRARWLFVDRASVRVGSLGRDRIEAYVASGQWRGKAGAYNLRERLEDGWPIEYAGDPTTIMGLPMGVLRGRLARLMEDP